MFSRARIAAVLAVASLAFVAGQASVDARPAQATGVVESVTDGDTLRLTNGLRVRLLQIDTPELGSGECYSRAARTALLQRVPVGSRVVLEGDPRLDRVDRYGRLLRYVHRGTTNVNVALVRAGAAAPYFYGGDRGRYSARLYAEATRAKAAKRGLWGACPRTVLDPENAVETSRVAGARPAPLAGGGRCDPNYAGGCVPHHPPDVDCADVRALGIAPVRVVGSDPHRLDGDGDGWGCE
jgi:endonuclease YncB( thermonuclease family)